MIPISKSATIDQFIIESKQVKSNGRNLDRENPTNSAAIEEITHNNHWKKFFPKMKNISRIVPNIIQNRMSVVDSKKGKINFTKT